MKPKTKNKSNISLSSMTNLEVKASLGISKWTTIQNGKIGIERRQSLQN